MVGVPDPRFTPGLHRDRKGFGTLSGVRVLIVEDELGLREGLADLLSGDGHEVVTAADGVAAVDIGTSQPFDVVVLDLMLPRMDGTEVCRKLRAARPGMGIVMLTARQSLDDKVRGLSDGADDYVTKPFAARELLARVRAVGRRAEGDELERIAAGDLAIDLARLTYDRGGEAGGLSAREVGILRLLYRNRDRAVPRAELLEKVWGARGDLKTRAVDMAISTLRKKLEIDPSAPVLIRSVVGVGYAWGGGD